MEFSKSKSLILNNQTQPRFNKMLAIRGIIPNTQKIDCKNTADFRSQFLSGNLSY